MKLSKCILHLVFIGLLACGFAVHFSHSVTANQQKASQLQAERLADARNFTAHQGKITAIGGSFYSPAGVVHDVQLSYDGTIVHWPIPNLTNRLLEVGQPVRFWTYNGSGTSPAVGYNLYIENYPYANPEAEAKAKKPIQTSLVIQFIELLFGWNGLILLMFIMAWTGVFKAISSMETKRRKNQQARATNSTSPERQSALR